MLSYIFHLFILGYATCLPTVQKPLTETLESPLNAKFDELVEDLLQHFKVPGLSIAVINNGKIYTKVYKAFKPSSSSSTGTIRLLP